MQNVLCTIFKNEISNSSCFYISPNSSRVYNFLGEFIKPPKLIQSMNFLNYFFDRKIVNFLEFLKNVNSTNFIYLFGKFHQIFIIKKLGKKPLLQSFHLAIAILIDFLNYICHFEILTQYYDYKTLYKVF